MASPTSSLDETAYVGASIADPSPLLSLEVTSVQSHNEPQGTSWLMTACIIANAALGAGMLNFPDAFNSAGGISVAMTMQIVLVILATISLFILAWCADISNVTTYQETVGVFCGAIGKHACSFVTVCYCYGACIALLVIVGDQTDRVFFDKFGSHFCWKWYLNRKFIVSIAACLTILPFCYSKTIDFLKYASGLASIGVFYLVFLIIYVYYGRHDGPVETKKEPTTWTDVFLVLPTLCFAYQCHVSIVPCYACLRPRRLKVFFGSIILAITVTLAVYSTVGIYGYLTFGTSVQPDILKTASLDNVSLGSYILGMVLIYHCFNQHRSTSSLSVDQPVVAIGFFFFAFKAFFSYPILGFCGRVAVESLWIDILKVDSVSVVIHEQRRRIVFATLWFFSSLLIAIFVPSIKSIIDVLGSLAAIFIFVFPGWCLLNISMIFESQFPPVQVNLTRIVSLAFIVLGVFLFGLTFAQGIQYNLQQHPDSVSLCQN